jgi:hypothetical protein
VAIGEREGARVVYRPPEPRQVGPGSGFGLLALLGAALLLFGGGLALGRLTASHPAAPARPARSPVAAAQAPQGGATATTAPTLAVPSAGAATSQVGPARSQNGVPVGYQHSAQGAVAAATNYTAVLSSDLILDPARRQAAIATLAAPEARAGLERAFAQTVPAIAKALGDAGGSKVVMRFIPVGWRLERYDGATASVSIWATGIGGSLNGIPVQEGWGITTVELRWTDNDWKETSASTRDGPVPVADDSAPTAASVIVPEAQQFKEYHYAPGS